MTRPRTVPVVVWLIALLRLALCTAVAISLTRSALGDRRPDHTALPAADTLVAT